MMNIATVAQRKWQKQSQQYNTLLKVYAKMMASTSDFACSFYHSNDKESAKLHASVTELTEMVRKMEPLISMVEYKIISVQCMYT